jgi:hypothetical protein
MPGLPAVSTVGRGHKHGKRAAGWFATGTPVSLSVDGHANASTTADVTGVPSDGTVAYQWNENAKAVHTGQTYLIADGDVGQKLTVTTTVAEGGNSISVTGGQTGAEALITVAITASKAGYVTATVRLAENTKVKAG